MVCLGPAKSGFSSSWWAAVLLREKQSCRGAFWSTAGCARAASQSLSRPQRSSALDLVANALWNKCHLKSIQPRKSTRCNSSELFFLEGWELLLKGMGAGWPPALCTRGASQVPSALRLPEVLQKWHRAQTETFPPRPLTFTVKVFFCLTCEAFACEAEVLGRDEKGGYFYSLTNRARRVYFSLRSHSGQRLGFL